MTLKEILGEENAEALKSEIEKKLKEFEALWMKCPTKQ